MSSNNPQEGICSRHLKVNRFHSYSKFVYLAHFIHLKMNMILQFHRHVFLALVSSDYENKLT